MLWPCFTSVHSPLADSPGLYFIYAALMLTVNFQFRKILSSGIQLLATANAVPSSLILFIPMMEVICSSEMSVLTRATQRYIPEDGVLHSHQRENLKSYISIYWFLLFHMKPLQHSWYSN
jgi:hypothetical protein